MRRGPLAAFPIISAYIGCAFMFGNPARTGEATWETAKTVAPMPVWGTVFVVGALITAAGLLRNRKRPTTVALFIGGTVFLWWGLVLLPPALDDPAGSITLPGLHLFLAFAHYYAATRIRVPR